MLSVIIVNYNVKYFLEQCLHAVEKALLQYPGPAGILVVDNASQDGSLEYLAPKFPSVRFIASPENTGFARANNLGLAASQGEYVLFLNPDTILAEDSLAVGVAFLSETPAAGAIGLRMIDGSGAFLKESRRGFPSPWASFCKLSGLTTLFPDSRFFAGYYLGGTDATKNGPAPILSGACMLVRRQVLEHTGGFDERFFMYAEDIDLSHRIRLAGYANYYVASTTIIHFKGESTQKDARYVKQFYKAMSQFSHKYFKRGAGIGFIFLMDSAIACRGLLSAIFQLFGKYTGKGTLKKRRGPAAKQAGTPTCITGDPQTMAALKERFAAKEQGTNGPAEGRIFVEDPGQALDILFCEGPAFSFKRIIAEMAKRPGAGYLIHASGSHSVTGSHSNKDKGRTIIL
ncbi:MAG: glycosyltransferase family 2 protein [Puia sp.]|nr:glycosyltransferase family 2 protein [Puia sp.]